jgi:hypothetical protein
MFLQACRRVRWTGRETIPNVYLYKKQLKENKLCLMLDLNMKGSGPFPTSAARPMYLVRYIGMTFIYNCA